MLIPDTGGIWEWETHRSGIRPAWSLGRQVPQVEGLDDLPEPHGLHLKGAAGTLGHKGAWSPPSLTLS